MDDLSRFCCLNPDCPDHGRRNPGNLTVPARYGLHMTRVLRCSTCKARFSERKGTPLFDTRLPAGKIVSVLAHVAEGIGTRKTVRLVGGHRDTVTRYIRRAGEQAQHLHDERVAFSPTTNEAQFDEKWDFVGKQGEELRPGREAGRRLLGPRRVGSREPVGREAGGREADRGRNPRAGR